MLPRTGSFGIELHIDVARGDVSDGRADPRRLEQPQQPGLALGAAGDEEDPLLILDVAAGPAPHERRRELRVRRDVDVPQRRDALDDLIRLDRERTRAAVERHRALDAAAAVIPTADQHRRDHAGAAPRRTGGEAREEQKTAETQRGWGHG